MSGLRLGSMGSIDPWIRPMYHPGLLAGEVHVWRVSLRSGAARTSPTDRWISDQDRIEAERFQSGAGRHRFGTTRGVLRLLLASYLGIDLEDIALTRGRYGKPMIEAGVRTPPLFFNIAHSHDLALIAVSLDNPVGIDIELAKAGFDWEPIARRFYAQEEYAFLMSMPAEERLRTFVVLWTRKEACLKAAGLGVAGGLKEVEVSVDPGRRATLVRAPREMLPVSRWNLHDLVPADGYQGCLVAEDKDVCVRQLVWSNPSEVSSSDPGSFERAEASLSRTIEQGPGHPPS